MKYAIKKTSLTFKEEIMDKRFDSKEEAAAIAKTLNRAFQAFYSVVEVEEPEVKRITKVTRNGKSAFIGDIRAFPGAPYHKTTVSMEFVKFNVSEEEENIFRNMGYTVSHIEVSRATFDNV